jgi:hypothetical protein
MSQSRRLQTVPTAELTPEPELEPAPEPLTPAEESVFRVLFVQLGQAIDKLGEMQSSRAALIDRVGQLLSDVIYPEVEE